MERALLWLEKFSLHSAGTSMRLERPITRPLTVSREAFRCLSQERDVARCSPAHVFGYQHMTQFDLEFKAETQPSLIEDDHFCLFQV